MANIAILNYCNLQCPYCFANKFITEEKKQFITDKELDDILNFLSHSTNFGRIGIIGGEPTIHPKFEDVFTKISNFAEQHNVSTVTFSNGIELYNYAKLFNKQNNVLINLNHPDIIGEEKWNKINLTLNTFKALNNLDHITLGINLYPDIIDYQYIIKMSKKFGFRTVRCSYVAPTCNYNNIDKDEYYLNAKNLFLNFVKDCENEQIQIHLDCNNIPLCYFSEEEKIILNKNVTGWHNLCNPVVDITPDMKATACFGAYSLIDLKQFDNIQEAENYFLLKKMYPKRLLNNGGKCQECKKFLNLSCQGGCLAFTKNSEEVYK